MHPSSAPPSNAHDAPRLSVTALSQYVRLRNCDRFLRFRLRPEEGKALLEQWDLTMQPLTPLLKDSGEAFEQAVEDALARDGERVIEIEDENDYDALGRWMTTVRDPVTLTQVPVRGTLGRYACVGVADLIRLRRDDDGGLHILVADIKSSRQERMEHRLQVAAYAYLIQQYAETQDIPIASLSGRIIHDTEDGFVPLADQAAHFDLTAFESVLDRLVLAEDSTTARIAAQDFEDVPFQLGYWCDGCLYNEICMYDATERRDLSLIPHITAVEKRVLQQQGLRRLEDVALLMDLPAPGERQLRPAPGQQERVLELLQVWPLGTSLPLLVQRARRALRRFRSDIQQRTFLYEAGFGTLPADDDNPGLVKVFLDVQNDYLKNRLYLVAAHVTGPAGERTLVRSAPAPPTEAMESALLVDWVSDLLAAIGDCADAPRAPLHLYLYDTLDQRTLLEALKRHLGSIGSLPGFFDLLTQSPALEQPMVSFLAHELRERRNLGLVCAPLHDAARMLGFNWEDEQYRYFELFRPRLFDNRRTVLMDDDGTIRPRKGAGRDDPRTRTIESASRFNSQIPLEYAYGAWGELPENDRQLLRPFRQVTRDMLDGFAAQRVRALAHIEASFKVKARFLGKKPMRLQGLRQPSQNTISLARSLVEFLYLEHHAALQARLQTYALPLEQRVQTGEALLLRYEGQDDQNRPCFTAAFDLLGMDPEMGMRTFRPKEGSWMLLNPTDETISANKRKHGSLFVIDAIDGIRIVLDSRRIGSKNAQFKYFHPQLSNFEEGALYELDVMADDLNADKALEALAHIDGNTLYRLLEAPPAPEPVPEPAAHFAEAFISLADRCEAPYALTARQREVVRALPGDRILLVQGPPGTGKSHTLAWALFCRLLWHAEQGLPFRVAVTCKTHKAILVALSSVLSRWNTLRAHPTEAVEAADARGLVIAKLSGDAQSPAWPAGLACIDLYRDKRALDPLLQRPYLILGATPGALYTLSKYRGRDRGVDWADQPFDLLVIDEASQMSVPEAMLASAFLHEHGDLLVVGDHRQMPPIVAHNWEEEERRSTDAHEPYLSLFEFLLGRGTRRIALDQSFRLNRRLARFLRDNIYHRDNIDFFSSRSDQLKDCERVSDYVACALAPDYPIVFIEHDEASAQQYNTLELSLVTPLVQACQDALGLEGQDGLGVVVPHRAQRALLQEQFPDLAAHEAIDTVERFQGGERDVIIVSATASDPDFVLAEAEFLLDTNRLNVAISRPRKKLIVIASRSITSLLVSDLELFERAAIWKRLYHQCARTVLWEGTLGGHTVQVRGCPA